MLLMFCAVAFARSCRAFPNQEVLLDTASDLHATMVAGRRRMFLV